MTCNECRYYHTYRYYEKNSNIRFRKRHSYRKTAYADSGTPLKKDDRSESAKICYSEDGSSAADRTDFIYRSGELDERYTVYDPKYK